MSGTRKRRPWLFGLLLLSGCLHPVRHEVDAVICDMAAHPLDLQPSRTNPALEQLPTPQPARIDNQLKPAALDSYHTSEAPKSGLLQVAATQTATDLDAKSGTSAQQKSVQPGAGQLSKFEQRLQLPQELPGARAELKLPPYTASREAKRAALQGLFPALPPLPALPPAAPGPFGHPLTLSELQQLALANSPLLRQAASDLVGAKGAAKQAGAYPNPNIGYESDNVGTGNTAGFQGFFIEQIIKTAGKLKVAQASALMDVANKQLALRRAQTDLMAQVRGGYFAVLVAQQNLKWSTDLSEFTERVYSISVENAVQGLLAGYEPMQLRALARQARGTLEQARNRYLTAWRQLAANLGLPDLPITELAGNAEMPVPVLQKEPALAQIRNNHTDLLTARFSQQKARYDLESARRQPYPDVDLRVVVQKDYTAPPFGLAENVQAGITIPVWDRNQGAIKQAQAALLWATEEEHRVYADLSSRLAEAFERYENNRALAEYDHGILDDLSRVYTRTLLRFNTQSPTADDKIGFVDITTNQQLYVAAVTTYAGVLQAYWQAAVDVSSLLQTDDFFAGTAPIPSGPVPDMSHLPCAHPCNPLQQRGDTMPTYVANGNVGAR